MQRPTPHQKLCDDVLRGWVHCFECRASGRECIIERVVGGLNGCGMFATQVVKRDEMRSGKDGVGTGLFVAQLGPLFREPFL